MLPTNTFNSKITEIENKIKTAESKPDISGLASKTELAAVENKIPDTNGFVKLSDYTNEITKIKNDYVTKTSLTTQLDNLKTTHIAGGVKKVDDKVSKYSSDILGFEKEASFNRGNY